MTQAPPPRQSFLEAWATLGWAERFRAISLVAQLAFLAVAVIGYVIASNGGSAALAVIGVSGVVGMVFARLVVALVGLLRRRNAA